MDGKREDNYDPAYHEKRQDQSSPFVLKVPLTVSGEEGKEFPYPVQLTEIDHMRNFYYKTSLFGVNTALISRNGNRLEETNTTPLLGSRIEQGDHLLINDNNS